MISVITFKYVKPTYRTAYSAEHVNTLRRMVARCYNHPHRFFCVTDDPTGLDPAIEYVPLWPDHFDLVNPSHPTSRPNCYPRLKLFSGEMEKVFGRRFVSLDLDMVLVDDVAPLWRRPDDFIIYDARGDDHYNGSMFLQTAGSREKVWSEFDPVRSPELTTRAGMRGSDQAWIRYCLSPDAATWTNADGVHAYLHMIANHPSHRAYRAYRKPRRRREHQTHGSRRSVVTHGSGQPKAAAPVYDPPGALPKGSRVVIFAGEYKPWDPRAHAMSPWITKHYV
jgi:hypothetical protein